MSQEGKTEPLHVQVARALGCRPIPQGQGDWFCDCDVCPAEGYQTGGIVKRYDTDWSAIGPLIERFDIAIWRNSTAWAAEVKFEWRALGQTPLLAVCNLILALHAAGKLTSAEPASAPTGPQ